MLGLGLSLTTGGVATPAYVALAKAFVTRVEADGGTVESFACLKTDMAYLTSNPAAPAGYTAEWSAATVGSSAEFRINLVGGAGYTYTYAVTDSQATEVTGTGVMGGNIQAVTADLSTLVDGTVTLAVYLTGAGGDGPVVTDTATLVGVDADYQAILDRGTALGYTLPSPSQQVLQEALIADLKTAGVWDKLDLFYVFATDGDSNYATLNWKTPASFQATKVNSPTFTADSGFTGDGTSAYLNTSFRPLTNGNNYQANNASIGVYYNSSLSSNNLYLSAYRTGADTDETFLRAGGASPNTINNNNPSNRDAFSVVGDFAQIHRDSSNQYLFTNGIQTDSLAITGSNSLTDFEVYLFGLNNGGSIAALSNAQINFFYLGSTMISESSDFYNALNTYKSAL